MNIKQSLAGYFWAISLFVNPGTQWAQAQDLCSTQMSTLLYSARFEWNDSSTQIKVGVFNSFKESQPIAQIWSGTKCQAVCKLKNLEREGNLKPLLLDLECQGVAFSPLVMRASILWGGSSSRHLSSSSVIRFGTWISGYEEAALKVEVDRYSTPDRVNRKVALLTY